MSKKITKEQVRAHLKTHWKKAGGCGVCGSNAWKVGDEEFIVSTEDRATTLPLAIITCESCGNVLTLSADVIREKTPSPV